MLNIFGIECGLIKVTNGHITDVLAPNGEKSKLYDDLYKHIEDLDKDTREGLRDAYRSWQGTITGNLDDNKNLAHALWAQTHSPNFKEWFKDSKVVDKNGEPLIVYHGTHESFNTFDKTKSGNKTGQAKELPGFYFFDHPYAASEYTINPKGGKAAYQRFDHDMQGMDEAMLRSYYPDIFKSYDNAPDSEKEEGIEGFAWSYFNKETEKGNVLPVFLSTKNPLIYDNRGRRIATTDIVSKLKSENDGVEVQGVMDRLNDSIGFEDTVHIVFEPNQIKLVFNQGQYSTQKREYNEPHNFHSESFDTINDYSGAVKRKEFLESKGAKDVTLKGTSISYHADADNIYFQSSDTVGSKASDVTVTHWKSWFKDQNVSYEVLTDGIKDEKGNPIKANEAVDVVNGIVQVAEGHENTAIGEAGMHIITRIIKNIQPKLFKEMMNRIGSYDLFEKTIAAYKDFKNYQLSDGKPDIAKIKEEVIGKLLNELYIQDQEGSTEKPELLTQSLSWWGKIKQSLKDFFTGNPFTKSVNRFKEGTYDNAEVEKGKEDTFFQASEDKGKKIFDIFKNQSNIKKVTDIDGNSKYLVTNDLGKEVEPENRVTDFAKKVYESKFGKQGTQGRNPMQEKVDRETGTRLHGYIEDVIARNVDSATGLRKESDSKTGMILPGEEKIYNDLDTYINQVLDRYPEGTKFLSEQIIYKPGKRAGKEDVAGTLDFLAILPNGAVANLDWKFMNEKVSRTATADISNITQKAQRTQLGMYGTILRTGYGIKEIVNSNTVPFKIIYGKEKDGEKYILKNVIIGDADYKKINDRTLLPVVSNQVDITGDPKTTALIRNLNKLIDKISNEKNVPNATKLEHERQLQELTYAVRKLVAGNSIWETANVGFSMVKSYIADINEVEKFIENKTKSKENRISSEDAGMLLSKLTDAMEGLEIFKDMKVNLLDYMKDLPDAEKAELNKLLTRINDNIDFASQQLFDKNTGLGILQKAGIKIGENVDIFNLLSLDKNMNKLQRLFNTSSSSTFKTAQVWYKYRSKARNAYEMKAADMAKELGHISEKIQEWMGGNWDNDKLLNTIAKKDKNGKYKPYLISKISADFYEKLSKAQESKDHQWVLDNIDVAEYKKDYDEDLKKIIDKANSTVFDALSYTEDETGRKGTLDQELREKYVQWFTETFNIDNTSSAFTYRNNRLRYYATQDNWSGEFKNLNKAENKPALDLFNYVVELNKRAHGSGMLGDYYIHFLPQIRKRTMDNLLSGNFKGMKRSLISHFITEEGERKYRDPITGEVVNSIRGKYTYDLGKDDDYSEVSTDIMKSLVLYAKEVAAHEELSKIEGIAKTLIAIEGNKKTLQYEHNNLIKDSTGKPIGGKNEENLNYLMQQVDFDLYGEKRVSDPGIGITINGEDKYLSYAKTIDTIVQSFTLKSLGLNPQSAFANLFGGSANAYINSGRHFTKTELTKAYYDVLGARFYTEEGKKFIALLDHFVPFTEEIAFHLGKHASKQKVLNWLSGDGLMVLMRKSDNVIQMANASVYFQNTMIESGKLINIREFVKNKYDYQNIYNKSISEQSQIKELIEKEVKQLQNTRNLFNDKSIKFDTKTFDVDLKVERYSDSELDLREKIVQLTRDCLGNRTPDEIAHINSWLLGSALMNFRNWVPRLAQKRFGEFKYHPGLGTYEIGRARMLVDVMSDHAQGVIGKVLKTIYGTATKGFLYANFDIGKEGIINAARSQYQRRLAQASEIEQTDETMFSRTVSEAEFIDQYLHAVKGQVKELQTVVALMGAFYAALAYAQSLPKDDDNYAQRGAAKWTVRMMDKFSDELGFFYNYASAKQMLGSGGNPIPVFSTITDLGKFLTNLTKEGYYLGTGDEDAEEKNKVIKYPISYIPVVNQFSSYFGMFNEDWGKVMGYKPTYHYGGFAK